MELVSISLLFLSCCKHGMELGGVGRWGEHTAGELLRGSVSLAPCFSPLPFLEVSTGMEHLSRGVTVPWIPALNGGKTGQGKADWKEEGLTSDCALVC